MTFKKIIAVTASLMSLIALAAVPAFAESTFLVASRRSTRDLWASPAPPMPSSC